MKRALSWMGGAFARVSGFMELSIFPQVRRLFYLDGSARWKLRVSADDGRIIYPYGAADMATRTRIEIQIRQSGGRQRERGKEREREDSCSLPAAPRSVAAAVSFRRIHHGRAPRPHCRAKFTGVQFATGSATRRALIKYNFVGSQREVATFSRALSLSDTPRAMNTNRIESS